MPLPSPIGVCLSGILRREPVRTGNTNHQDRRGRNQAGPQVPRSTSLVSTAAPPLHARGNVEDISRSGEYLSGFSGDRVGKPPEPRLPSSHRACAPPGVSRPAIDRRKEGVDRQPVSKRVVRTLVHYQFAHFSIPTYTHPAKPCQCSFWRNSHAAQQSFFQPAAQLVAADLGLEVARGITIAGHLDVLAVPVGDRKADGAAGRPTAVAVLFDLFSRQTIVDGQHADQRAASGRSLLDHHLPFGGDDELEHPL